MTSAVSLIMSPSISTSPTIPATTKLARRQVILVINTDPRIIAGITNMRSNLRNFLQPIPVYVIVALLTQSNLFFFLSSENILPVLFLTMSHDQQR